ncbi:MAG: energy transducer TonB [Desulfobacterales bacterium]|nr:energy transducer TonB [Desulfobacterales bacterium]
MTAENGKKQPNWVLRGMLVISLGIHVVIFMHIAGLYRSNALNVIELTVREEEPPARSIPRPRMRHKTPQVNDVKKIQVPKPHMPKMKMDQIEADSPDTITEQIAMPDTSGLSADVAEWSPPGAANYLTKGDYFDMLRLKIESKKKYPPSAQKRQIEGRVVVGFTIDPDGRVTSAEIVRSSRHSALDRAALDAVKSAAPFPRPPSKMFDGPLEMKITIMFELT